MRLGCELAQRRFGVFDGLALGAESGVPQARTPRLAIKAVTPSPIATIPRITASAKTTPCIAAVAARGATAVISPGGFCLFHARTVIATHRHDLLRRGGWLGGRWGFPCGGFTVCIGRC
jgi:hypothetical protein